MLVKTAETKKPHEERRRERRRREREREREAAEANNHQNRVVNFPSGERDYDVT